WPACRCNRNRRHRSGTKEITLVQHRTPHKECSATCADRRRHLPKNLDPILFRRYCPLGQLRVSRSSAYGTSLPLLKAKRTSKFCTQTSEFDPTRTSS